MLTEAEITAQAANLIGGHLSTIAQRQLLTAIQASEKYSTGVHHDLADKLGGVVDVPAQMCLAVLRKIEQVGPGTTQIQGGADALDFSIVRDRDEWVIYVLTVLYGAFGKAGKRGFRQIQMVSSVHATSCCGDDD